MNEETHNSTIEPELEARIVALVLGEASDFEADELNRLIALRPELAAFQQEMQQVHELMQNMGAGELETPGADWKLSVDRRESVLAVLRDQFSEESLQQSLSGSGPELDEIAPDPASGVHNAFAPVDMQSTQWCKGPQAPEAGSEGNRSIDGRSPRHEVATSSQEAPAEVVSAHSGLNPGTSPLARRIRVLLADSLGPFASSVRRRMRKTPMKIAAGICVAGFIGLMTVPSFLRQEAMPAKHANHWGSAADGSESTEEFMGRGTLSRGPVGFFDSAPTVGLDLEGTGGAVHEQHISGLDAANANDALASTRALSTLQQTLNGGGLAASEIDKMDSFRSYSATPRPAAPEGWFEAPSERRFLNEGRSSLVRSDESAPVVSPDEVAIPQLATAGDEKSLHFSTEINAPVSGPASDRRDGLSRSPLVAGTIDMPAPPQSFAAGSGIEPSTPRLRLPLEKESGGKVWLDFDFALTDVDKKLEDMQHSRGAQRFAGNAESAGDAAKDNSENAASGKSDGEQPGIQLKRNEALGRTNNSIDRMGTIAQDPSHPFSKQRNDVEIKVPGEPEGKTKGRYSVFFRQGEADRLILADSSELEKKPAAKPAAPPAGLNETSAAAEAFSTFSLHVSDVSFKLVAAALARGEWPETAKVRIEEFVNAFDYGDPLPGKGEKVACVVEQGIHPFLQQRNVLRVSMRTSAEGRASTTPLRLTFLLDNSGSMERPDRQETIRRAFTLLAQQLSPIDQVTLISFARQPRILAEKVSGAESGQLVKLIDELPSEGGTNIEAALQLAFEKATALQTPGAQNRIVLLTDGAVNLGNADPESLSRMVSSMREAGIAFDAAGISADGLNDDVLEALTRKGDGRYYLMDSGDDADDNFVQQIAGALRPSASNVKVQVEFNPKRVGQYKLLGFEKHLLKQEDFRNDAVDAAEMAAAEAGVAMYQFEAKPDGEGDVGSVSVRFKDLSTGQMVENRWPIPYEPNAVRLDQATPSLRIATAAAMLAAKLKGEALGETVDLQTLSQLIDGLPSQIQSHARIQQLKLMIEQARQIGEK